MATKQNRSKQQKLRKQENVKRLGRLRAATGNPNLTHEEAVIYQRALNCKETPVEFLNGAYSDVKAIIDTFAIIERTHSDESVMAHLEQCGFADLKAGVEKAHQFLASCNDDLDAIHKGNLERVTEIDPKDKLAILNVLPIAEQYDQVTLDLQSNTMNLMSIVEEITRICFTALAEEELND